MWRTWDTKVVIIFGIGIVVPVTILLLVVQWRIRGSGVFCVESDIFKRGDRVDLLLRKPILYCWMITVVRN